jgi:hypothetical protein
MAYYHAKVYRYNKELQNIIGSKINPEPWMHLVVNTQGWYMNGVASHEKPMYAIYIWDTRQVLESGNFDKNIINQLPRESTAKDDRKPLIGSGKVIDSINSDFEEHSKEITGIAEIIKKTKWTEQELNQFPSGKYLWHNKPITINAKRPWAGIVVAKWLNEKDANNPKNSGFGKMIDGEGYNGKMNNFEYLTYLANVIQHEKLKPMRDSDYTRSQRKHR